MPDLEIANPIAADDIREWLVPVATGLLFATHGDEFEARVASRTRRWLPDRAWGVRDRGRWVATLATEPRRLSVPAGPIGARDLAVDALTLVSVSATHRRRGLLRRMIDRSLQAAVDRGDAVSMLIAAEWPIYGRFGYAPATDLVQYRLRPRRPNPLLPPLPAGVVRTVDAQDLLTVAGPLFEAARRLRPGQVDRDGPWWERHLGLDGLPQSGRRPTWVVHDGPDGVDGMLGWNVTRDFDLADNLGAIEVGDFVAATDDAYRHLWAYLCGIDVISEVVLHDRPVDEPIRWALHDGRALATQSLADELWIKVLDVPAALAARGYAGSGQLVLEVVDDTPARFAAGRYRLDVNHDEASCVRTDASPDLRLDQRNLASVYLGGRRLRQLAFAGGVDELTPGAIDRADALFATSLAPWTQTGF